MKKHLFLLIFAIIFFVSLVKSSPQATQKLNELRYLSSKSSEEGIITLNITGFNYYVLESPRPYDLVIFFTANDCKLCDLIYDELLTVAKTYRAANTHFPVRTEGSKQRAVFFAKLKFTQETKDIFVGLNFNSVPNIIVTQPKLATIEDIQRPIFLRDFTWQISPTDGQVTAQKLLDFVNKRTNRNIEYREPIWNMFIPLVFIIAIGVLGYKLFFMFHSFFLNEKFWFTGSLIIYAICMAGVVYNIIHDVPFTNIDRNGNFEWFHSGSRSQFGAEGFVMSIVIAFIGLLLILVQKLVKLSDNENTVRMISLVALFSVYYLVGFVEETYRKKSWYGPQFWPPEHYIKGPLMRDQGNNI